MAAGAAVTTPVRAERAGVERPPRLAAMTDTRSVDPTSRRPGVYVRELARAIAVQRLPARLQRFHLYLNEVGACDQVPGDAVSLWPATAIPLIDGGLSLRGRVADDPP